MKSIYKKREYTRRHSARLCERLFSTLVIVQCRGMANGDSSISVTRCALVLIVVASLAHAARLALRSTPSSVSYVRRLLESQWTVFREELGQLPRSLITHKHRAPGSIDADLLKLHSAKSGWIHSWNADGMSHGMWLNFALVFAGHPVGKNSDLCPRSMALLQRIPGLQIAGFSWIKPHGVIEEHTDNNFDSLNRTWHVGLDVPPKCYLTVRANARTETFQHVNGGVLMFDARNPHWAVNFSELDRIVLYLDVKMT